MTSATKPEALSCRATLFAPCLVRVNTMARTRLSSLSKCSSAARFRAVLTCTTFCWIFATVTSSGVTSMRTGLRRISLESFAISVGMVAENNNVWRCIGSALMMRRTSGIKPMSIKRSHSSSTKNCVSLRLICPWFIKSSSRPGAATKISTPARSFLTCGF